MLARRHEVAAAETGEAELRQGFALAGVECLTLSTYARLELALLKFACGQQVATTGALQAWHPLLTQQVCLAKRARDA